MKFLLFIKYKNKYLSTLAKYLNRKYLLDAVDCGTWTVVPVSECSFQGENTRCVWNTREWDSECWFMALCFAGIWIMCTPKTVNKLISSGRRGLRRNLLEIQYLWSQVYQSKLFCQHFTLFGSIWRLSMMDAVSKLISRTNKLWRRFENVFIKHATINAKMPWKWNIKMWKITNSLLAHSSLKSPSQSRNPPETFASSAI